jgi:hypothetical protein
VARIVVVHFSARDDFEPAAIESVFGQGEGLWVYPVRAMPDREAWGDRRPYYFTIESKYLLEVQRFRKGELRRKPPDPPHLVIEMFVPAQHLHRLRPSW